jgi:hypothetical protein
MTERTEQDIRAELMWIYSNCQAEMVDDSMLASIYADFAQRASHALREGTPREIMAVQHDFRVFDLEALHEIIEAMLRGECGGS